MDDGFWLSLPERHIQRLEHQHLLTRNRQFDLVEVIEEHPELLGIGIDEKTGVVITGDTFEVIGRTCITVYDHERLIPPNGKFFVLMPGDTYNMKTKEAFRPTESKEPFEHITHKKWSNETMKSR